jgi:hypothetical protein
VGTCSFTPPPSLQGWEIRACRCQVTGLQAEKVFRLTTAQSPRLGPWNTGSSLSPVSEVLMFRAARVLIQGSLFSPPRSWEDSKI